MRPLVLVAALCAASLSVPPVLAASKAATRSAASAAKFHRATALPKWVQPLAEIPATKRTDPVVNRLHETQSVSGLKPAIMINKAIQVNDKAALPVIGQFGIPFLSAYQSLHLHRVTIIRDGKELDRLATVNVRMLDRELAMENNMYGGATTAQLLLEDVRAGDTLWITYTIEGANPVFGNTWTDEFSWEAYAPIEHRKVTVLLPKGRTANWRQLGDFSKAEIRPRVDQAGEFQRYVFEGRDIEAVDNEGSVPSDYLFSRMLQFSEYGSWNDVAKWASSMFPPARPGKDVIALAQQFRTKEGKLAQASAALQWIQNEIRYFSVSIGENSHRPQAPDVVLRRRYGDCKDKSYLLVTVLKELGIEARPVLLNASALRLPAKIFPTPTWFDHVIVQVNVDGKQYYVDPTQTDQPAPLEKLSPLFPDAAALVVAADSTALISLPANEGTPLLYEIEEHMTASAFDEPVTLELTETWRGIFADRFRSQNAGRSATEIKRDALKVYEKRYPGVALVDAPKVKDDPASNVLVVTSTYTLPGAIKDEEGRYMIGYAPRILDGSIPLPDKLVRSFPLRFANIPVRMAYRLSIDWPDNVRSHAAPAARTVDSPYFRVNAALNYRGNRTEYLLDYQMKKVEVEAAEVPALHKAVKRLENFTGGDFLVSQSALSDAANVSPRDLDAFRYTVGVGDNDKELMAMSDEDFTNEATCTYIVESALQKQVLSVAQEAMAKRWYERLARLKTAEARACKARLAFNQGAHVEAAKLHKAGGLSASRELAWSLFHAGDAAGAVEMFAQVLAANKENDDYNSHLSDLVEQHALHKRAGAKAEMSWTLDPNLYPRGPWPMPLLAWQVGVVTQEELFKLIDSYPLDAATMAKAEAWFMIGQSRLAMGDKAGARTAFMWLDEHGLRSSHLSALARTELAQLPALANDTPEAAYQQGLRHKAALVNDAALASFLSAAERGHLDAAAQAGRMLATGDGVPVDDLNALIWLERAADRGNAEALFHLARVHEQGRGVPANAAHALTLYSKAANLGWVEAQVEFGSRLAGSGDEASKREAVQWFRKAAEAGHPVAQAELASSYLYGKGISKDPRKALELFRLSAEQGNVEGLFHVGYMYDDEPGVPADHVQARKWYRLAADKGHQAAKNNLARLFELGKGGDKDLVITRNLYEETAKAGNEIGVKELIRLAKSGAFGDLDSTEWARYLKLGWEARNDEAGLGLSYFYQLGAGGLPVDGLKAASILIDLADRDNVHAKYRLGLAYEFGWGGVRDQGMAYRWYERAADSGHASARARVIRYLEDGVGVAKNTALAETKLAALLADRQYAAVEQMAWDIGELGQRERAEALIHRMIAARKKQSPSDLEALADGDFTLSRMLANRGANEAMLERATAYLAAEKKIHGEEHSHVAKALDWMGEALIFARRIEEARPFIEKSLAMRTKLHGSNHADVANSLESVALLNGELRNFVEAEAAMRKAIDMLVGIYGEKDARSADAQARLARMLSIYGKVDEAAALYEKAIKLVRVSLGEYDENTLRLMRNQTINLGRQKKYVEAEPEARRLVEVMKLQLGEQHPRLASALNGLGVDQLETGKFKEAEASLLASLDIDKRVFGDDSWEASYPYANLGALYSRTGRAAEGEALLRKALAIRERRPWEERLIADNLHDLGRHLAGVGRRPEAVQVLRRALELRRRSLPEQHVETRETQQLLDVTELKLAQTKS